VGEWQYSCTLSSTSALDGVGWLTPRPGRCTPGKRDSMPIVHEAGWGPVPVWEGAKNIAPTGIRSLDHPARSNRSCVFFVIQQLKTLNHVSPAFNGKGSHRLLWAGSCATRGKMTISGIHNCLNYGNFLYYINNL
jgi:hypothetical protein